MATAPSRCSRRQILVRTYAGFGGSWCISSSHRAVSRLDTTALCYRYNCTKHKEHRMRVLAAILLLASTASAEEVGFDSEKAGAPSESFEAVVGDWYVGEIDGKKGLMVDGSRWRQGTPSASLADQARRLYGERYAEFL